MPKEYVTPYTPKIKLWRQRMRRYHKLRQEISLMLLKKGYDQAQARLWLKTPQEELRGKAPRDLLNPLNIVRLHKWARSTLS